MATNLIVRNALFTSQGDGTFMFFGLTTMRKHGKGDLFTTQRAAMSITRRVAPAGPVPGQTIVTAADIAAEQRSGVFTTAKAVYDHRDAINAEAKLARKALKAFRSINVL